MSMSQNIFPEGEKWDRISAQLNNHRQGACIVLNFDNTSIAIHYGDETNRQEFVSRFKAAVAALPKEEPLCSGKL